MEVFGLTRRLIAAFTVSAFGGSGYTDGHGRRPQTPLVSPYARPAGALLAGRRRAPLAIRAISIVSQGLCGADCRVQRGRVPAGDVFMVRHCPNLPLAFQYSIRSLLLLTLAVALQCSWLAVERDEAKRQREAVKAIGDMLGSVMYDYDTGKSGPYTMFVSPPGQIWLRNVLGEDFFNNIATVNFLANPYVSDEDLGRIEGIIKALPQIQRLDLSGTQVTDAGVAKLKQALPGCRINH